MTWLAILLAAPSPCLRWLTLTELVDCPDDDEVRELAELRKTDPLITDLLAKQEPDGSWHTLGSGPRMSTVQATGLALDRLGYLGLDENHPAVAQGAKFLFTHQTQDGSWPLGGGGDYPEGYQMIPLQTALPLQGLARCGLADDARSERGYEWLLEQRLQDGSWPTGIASGVYGYVAGYRRLPHSRWGCRSNTTGALLALALHPRRRREEAARRALDLLLARETRERSDLGYMVARRIGAEEPRGFITHYARFDLANLVDLAWRVGASREDPRIADVVTWLGHQQEPNGLWRYPARPQASRWVTFDLLRSLSRLQQSADWVTQEPRTPFSPYPNRERRY